MLKTVLKYSSIIFVLILLGMLLEKLTGARFTLGEIVIYLMLGLLYTENYIRSNK